MGLSNYQSAMCTSAQENTGLAERIVSRILRKEPGPVMCGYTHAGTRNHYGRFHQWGEIFNAKIININLDRNLSYKYDDGEDKLYTLAKVKNQQSKMKHDHIKRKYIL